MQQQNQDLFERLKAPFPPDAIRWRVGATSGDRGLALAYINARDVMDRLDGVVGPGNWQDCYEQAGTRLFCTISIRIGDDWVQKSDGAGDTKVEPEKGGISDAFRRAAVKWGIGRYLYALRSPWVTIEKRGNSAVIPDRELERLQRFLDTGSLQLAGNAPVSLAQPPQPDKERENAYASLGALMQEIGADKEALATWTVQRFGKPAASMNLDELRKLYAAIKSDYPRNGNGTPLQVARPTGAVNY